MIGADALILHLNPVQEAVQSEGNHNFSGLLHKIDEVCSALDVPVIVKEVGFGISGDVARRLVDAGIAAIDVSGAGGTSWSAIESYRATAPLQQHLGEAFADWGIPTADSLRMVRSAVPDTPVVASGGMRNGLDAAKAIALGADLAGFAGPLLHAADESEERVVETLTLFREQLRLAMFATGVATVADLRHVPIMTNDGILTRS
jgi:isopentenyl-diphosphate Delta-isomerase